ncbi:MAG: TonB-dependent receptor [Bacteroidota bacterium]
MGKKLFAWLLGLAMLPGMAFAQATILGKITDSDTGEALPGASVLIEGTSFGAAADIDGNYAITGIDPGDYTLRITYVGYLASTSEVTIGTGETRVDIALDPDFAGLEEVIVTGISGTTSRARSEVSVERLDTRELLDKNQYTDVSQLMTGKIAGVRVLPSSGNVGGGLRFIMRGGGGLNGQGTPLIFIDGVRVNTAEFEGFATGGQGVSVLSSLNPDDIESIDVLKGPAASALYGTSGSNGVVIIKTKRGGLTSGNESSLAINYKGVYGQNRRADSYNEDLFVSAADANAVFRDGGVQQHTLSVSGGSGRVRYFGSFEQRNEEGHLPNNQLERRNFRVNFEAFPTENLTVAASANYGVSNIDRPQNDNNIFGFLGNTLLRPSSYGFTDSLAVLGFENTIDIDRFLGSVEATYRPVKGLSVRTSLGFDGSNIRNDALQPQNQFYSGVVNGERNTLNERVQQYSGDFSATYNVQATPRLSSTTIVGAQFFTRTREQSFFTRQNFPSELITNIGAGSDFIQGDELFTDRREAGILAQQSFDFDGTFFATAGARYDFASAFGVDAPAIVYPKASAAIRLDRLFNTGPFNFFKLRAAYGQTGVLPGLLDGSILLWTAEEFGYGIGAVTDFIGNTEIEPERVSEFEFGFDANLFSDRLNTTFSYYIQDASDSIIDFQNAPSTGLTASDVPFNVGGIDISGFEASIDYTVFRSRTNALNLGFIWNYTTNEVEDLGGAQPIFDGFDINVIEVGLPRSEFFTREVTGARFAEDGTYAGVEITDDRVALGNPFPDHTGSFSANLQLFSNFSVYALADWALGHRIFNNTLLFARRFGNDPRYNELGALLGLREQEGVTALEVGSQAYNDAANEYALLDWRHDSNLLEDADTFKLREVSIQYDASSLLRNQPYVRNLSIALAGRNLWQSSKYSLPDSEVNFDGGRSLIRGQDFLTLPAPRTFYLTLNLGF